MSPTRCHIYRATWFMDGKSESDAEHSFMLGLIATEPAYQYYPQLDIALVGELARVHDLLEIELDDIPTFTSSSDDLQKKQQ